MYIQRTHLTDQQKAECFLLRSQGRSSRDIAELVLGRSSRKSTVNDLFAREAQELPEKHPSILFIDIETAPSVTLAFSRFKAFASPDHVLEEPYILLYSYAWGVTGNVNTDSITEDQTEGNHKDILAVERLWELFDSADVVVAHNTKYDDGWINQQFCKYDLPPPSSYKVVCTLKALRNAFKLPSNSLAAATQYFNVERKLDNSGITLWKRCMSGEEEAFKEMQTYCEGDVEALQSLYKKILPYIRNHPNLSVMYNDDKERCRVCASETPLEEIEGKHSYTSMSKFQSYRCVDCGAVQRSRTNELSKEKLKGVKV